MKEEILVGVLMVFAVLLSGCTMPWQQTAVATTGGELTVEDFGPSHDYVIGGDTEEFVLSIRNNGDRDVQGVRAVPFLLGWSGFNTQQNCANTPLYKPNEELNRLGSPCTIRWRTVSVPTVDKQESFTAGVRIYYDYSTQASAKVYALTANQYAGLRERGVDVRSVKEVNPGTGPIQVNVMVDDVLIYGGNNNNLPVTLQFTNTGWPDGYPAGSTERDYQINRVEVTSDAASGINAIDNSDCNGVKLRGGQTGTCLIRLSVNQGYNQAEIITDLRITAYYTYVKEVRKTFYVSPRL